MRVARAGRSVGVSLIGATILLASCGAQATLPAQAGFGPSPQLPAPHKGLLPTIKIASAVGWPKGATPTPATDLTVNAFASGLDHPRWLYVLPNGDVLVAETNAPPKPDDGKGLRGFVQKQIMGKAGATVPSPNKILLLRDANGDGVAETRSEFITGLNSPYGMALVGGDLYVADTDAVLRFPYTTGETRIDAKGQKIADLPAGTINHHWTKNIIATPDGAKLFVTVGSNSNVGENGLAAETNRAGILEIDRATGATRVFASGLRNPNGMGFEPRSGALWTAVNERDEIGDDLVPDYMTSVKEGDFYGWPFSYYGRHVDSRVKDQRPDLVAKATIPDYALGAHTASLGLTFGQGASALPGRYGDGAFIGQHGSWNRSVLNGYKVVFIPFANGRPNGAPQDVLTGFIDGQGRAQGRPVGVVIDKRGGLLAADDVGNVIWRVTGKASAGPTPRSSVGAH